MLDEPAIAALTNRYGPMVLRRCRRLLVNEEDARDACQDVFMRLVMSRQRIAGEAMSSLPQVSLVRSVRQSVAGQRADISDQIADLDTGVAIGGGLEVAARRGHVVIDARVVLGLKQLNETAPPEFKSRAFTLLAGYRF